ncbi:hypothetical protein [Desulfoluna sp.]|uniref:hypothetical protein n=1 Tax=Desulfoluna sp. TaxID=2045199 RepID=UPI00261089FF|nr:hypothetical protein [Desulfoluna sp.]
MKRLIGADIVMAEVKEGVFYLDEAMIVTPMARDLLRDKKVKIIEGVKPRDPETKEAPRGAPECMDCSECVMDTHDVAALEPLIRQLVAANLAGNTKGFQKTVDSQSGVLCVKAETVNPAPFDTGKPGDKVYITDVVSLAESPRLGFGIMAMKEGAAFDWTLKYDEVDYIIEGTLDILIDGRKVTASKGDILFIPRNSAITFSTPDATRFMFCTYPADWADQ